MSRKPTKPRFALPKEERKPQSFRFLPVAIAQLEKAARAARMTKTHYLEKLILDNGKSTATTK